MSSPTWRGLTPHARAGLWSSDYCRNEFPDVKGIDTIIALPPLFCCVLVEMSSPTWRGLTHDAGASSTNHLVAVEMSSPTWRGLTQVREPCLLKNKRTVEMSSPTWRGLTHIRRSIPVRLHICRNEFPDVKGIDTRLPCCQWLLRNQ